MTSISVTNVVISGNYQSLIVHSDVVSLEVSNSVFDQCSHPSTTGGHIIYIVRGANTTDLRASVTVNALTVSNSINVDLNAGILDEHPIDFTYSNLDFYNVTSTAIVDFVSPSTTVENIYFSRLFLFLHSCFLSLSAQIGKFQSLLSFANIFIIAVREDILELPHFQKI